MKQFAFILLLSGLLAGCTTIATYQPHAPAGPPKPADYPILVYDPDMEIPRPCQLIGQISINHTPFTVIGGSSDAELQRVLKVAHQKGADVVQLTFVQKPGFTTTDYSMTANLLRYSDIWEKYPGSRDDFVAYLQDHRRSLDPIEGIWTDGLPHRIGIIRDTSKPGRDFIGFNLDTNSPTWPLGYKKMDIARGHQPDTYQIRFYHDDFSTSDIIITLDHDRSFNFLLNSEEKVYPITFTKLGPFFPTR
jgi:acetolactate synthase regulatory subunit